MNTALLTSDNPLRVKVIKVKNETALLMLPDKQMFEVSIKYLPKLAKEGSQFYLDFVSKDQLHQNKKEVAKAILEDILG